MRDVIIALDFKDRKTTVDFLDCFSEVKPFVKIGMELFYSEGPAIVREIKERGHKIFLDLKLHDIPNTVAGAMRSLAGLDVDMVNVHAGGGIEMMRAAAGAAGFKGVKAPLVIAVSQLTSTSERALKQELLIDKSMEETVLHYAQNTKRAGLDGIVCSPLEVLAVKRELGKDFVTVTPGIRFESSDADDQVRITTPRQAGKNGTDFIVVGRPITKAEDPQAAYMQCLRDFLEA